jgi:hypothetical protein
MEHEHDWKPIPLERAKYGCACGETGYRWHDGAIHLHKSRMRASRILGELLVTVNRTAFQLLALPSRVYESGEAPWSEGYRRRPLPNADRQANVGPPR